MTPFEAVQFYVELGAPVFPVHYPIAGGCSCGGRGGCSPGKHPAIANGVDGATLDLDVLEQVWDRAPWNVGVATGHTFDVLDVDDMSAIEALQTELGVPLLVDDPPVVWTSAGVHVMFSPVGAGNRVGFRDGFDWRGLGGYVLGAGSTHMSGHVYRLGGGPGVVPAPEPLSAILTPSSVTAHTDRDRPGAANVVDLGAVRQQRAAAGRGPFPVTVRPAGRSLLDELDVGAGVAGIEAAALLLADRAEGSRNALLYWVARRLYGDVVHGEIEVDELEGLEATVYAAAELAGLGSHEIERTMRGAERAEWSTESG